MALYTDDENLKREAARKQAFQQGGSFQEAGVAARQAAGALGRMPGAAFRTIADQAGRNKDAIEGFVNDSSLARGTNQFMRGLTGRDEFAPGQAFRAKPIAGIPLANPTLADGAAFGRSTVDVTNNRPAAQQQVSVAAPPAINHMLQPQAPARATDSTLQQQTARSGLPAPGIFRGGGYKFAGNPADAAKFFQPVGPTAGSLRGPQAGGQHAAFMAQKAAEAPQMLGPESGIGWKTRRAMYESQMQDKMAQDRNMAGLTQEGMQQRGAMARQQTGDAAALRRQQAASADATAMKQMERGWAQDDVHKARDQALEDAAANRQFQIYSKTGNPDAAASMGSGPWPTDYSKAQAFRPPRAGRRFQTVKYLDKNGDPQERTVDEYGNPLPEELLERLLA